MEYKYGMKYRGFAPMCQPMKDLIRREDSPHSEFYDILVYGRVLTQEEINGYELVPIQEGGAT